MLNTKASTRPITSVPYCFNSNKEALAAESAIKNRFPKISAYTIGKILYVQEHASTIMKLTITDYVRSLGGRTHN